MKNRILMLILGFCGLFGLTKCASHKEEKAEEPETRFQVTSPLRTDTTIVKDYVCQIHSIQHIEIRSLEKGYLQDIFVDEGQFVKKGQLMFKIMPNVYEAELRKAQAETKAAEIELANTKALADKNVVAPNELALAEAKLEKARAETELAKVHLSFTEIRAPFDGILDRLQVRKGSLLDEGDLLTTFSDNSKMWVYFNVPESEYLAYETRTDKSNMLKVDLKMANNQQFPYTGVVETVEGEFDNETGNIAYRATFQNPKRLLRHGETGNVVVSNPIKNALLIPQKATFEVLEKKYVFVIDSNNTVKSRLVEIEAELPHIFVIKSGLEESDKILLEGLRLVKENDKIEYDFMDPATVLSHLTLYAE